MIKLIRNELYKVFRKGRTYIGFGAITFIAPAILFGLYIDGQRLIDFSTQQLQDAFILEGNLLNGYLSTYLILNALWVHIPFLIALVAGDLLAGEANAGTFRLILTRPVSRFQWVIAKYTAAQVYTFLLVLWTSIVSLGLGISVMGTGELIVLGDTLYIFPREDVLWRILYAFGFAFFSMSAVASLAFLFSAFTDNSIGPIISTMAVIIVLMILSTLDLTPFRILNPFLFTTHMGNWKLFFQDPVPFDKILNSLFFLILHSLSLLGITAWWFGKKDILS